MSTVNINGNNFDDLNKARLYLEKLQKNEELEKQKKLKEEKEARLNEIQDIFDNLNDLTKRYEKDYDEKLIVLNEKVIPKSNEMFNKIERAFEQVNNQFYGNRK